MEKKFEKLEKIYGNHSQAARALFMTPRHYRKIRAGQQKATKQLEDLINLRIALHQIGR